MWTLLVAAAIMGQTKLTAANAETLNMAMHQAEGWAHQLCLDRQRFDLEPTVRSAAYRAVAKHFHVPPSKLLAAREAALHGKIPNFYDGPTQHFIAEEVVLPSKIAKALNWTNPETPKPVMHQPERPTRKG